MGKSKMIAAKESALSLVWIMRNRLKCSRRIILDESIETVQVENIDKIHYLEDKVAGSEKHYLN